MKKETPILLSPSRCGARMKGQFGRLELYGWYPQLMGIYNRYHNSFLMHPDPDIDATVNHNELNHLRNIAVPHSQGKFLNLLIKSVGAKRVLEIGTLGG